MPVNAEDGRVAQKINTAPLVGQARAVQDTVAAKDNGEQVPINAPFLARDGLAVFKINFAPPVRQGRGLLVIVVAKDVGRRVQINV